MDPGFARELLYCQTALFTLGLQTLAESHHFCCGILELVSYNT
jgi:hypothetical protein